MSNLTQNLEQNWTSEIISCPGIYYTITTVIYLISGMISFGTTLIVMGELLKRKYKRWKTGSGSRSSSPTEVLLLQMNLIDISNCVALLLHFLKRLGISISVYNFMIFQHPTFTAEPLFLLGICMTIYCAVVHPVTYMTAKTFRHWPWVFITLIWLYALIMEFVCFSYNLFLFHPVHMLSLYITLPAAVFFNVCTLRTLASTGPENGSQNPNPAKRKAFRIVLSILVVILVYYLPEVCYCNYRFIKPTTQYRSECFELQIVLITPAVCQIVLPGIFLYSVGKVGE